MVKRRNEGIDDEVLAGQVPEYQEPTNYTFTEDVEETVEYVEPAPEPEPAKSSAHALLGTKLSRNIGGRNLVNKEGMAELDEKANGTRLGGNIYETSEARAGWIPIDRRYLGMRDKFYPEDWVFYVRPATVEAVRNWSMLDETNGNSIDDVFNEILKYCLSIKTKTGAKSWQEINNWDRLFFILMIREYTFAKGENNIEFFEDCYECDESVRFTVESQALMYELPDESVFEYYDSENRQWYIDPIHFGVNSQEPITLYLPTLEKDANIKAWLISEYQENEKKKIDPVFIKFLPWLLPKVSKDLNAAKMQIRKAEMTFKSWDTEMFSFMNDVHKNIAVIPQQNISAICPNCGEEVVVKLRFPNGVGSIFNVVNKRSKFGTK